MSYKSKYFLTFILKASLAVYFQFTRKYEAEVGEIYNSKICKVCKCGIPY